MNRLPQNLSERRVQQVRRRVIALGLASPLRRYPRRHAPKAKGSGERTDRRGPAVDLPYIVDFDAPAVAGDLSAIGDLTAGFRVEGRLSEQHRDASVRQMTHRRRLRLDLDRVVADERAVGGLLASRELPLRPIGEAVRADGELFRLPLFLRSPPLPLQRRFKAGDVDDVDALARHQFREIDREAEGIVESERILAADGAAQIGAAVRRERWRNLLEFGQPTLDRR